MRDLPDFRDVQRRSAEVRTEHRIIFAHTCELWSIPGPDSTFSLEPHEFKEMVQAIRVTEQALGEVRYEVTEREAASRVFRRSLFAVKDIQAGELFTEENVRSIRPGHGLHPKYLSKIFGKRATKEIKKGTPLSWDLF